MVQINPIQSRSVVFYVNVCVDIRVHIQIHILNKHLKVPCAQLQFPAF